MPDAVSILDTCILSIDHSPALAMTTYPLAQHSWEDHEVITVSSMTDQLIGTFPMSFVRHAGLNPWEYILYVVGRLVECEQGGTLYTQDGTVIHRADVIEPGDYRFLPHGEFTVHYIDPGIVTQSPGDLSSVGGTVSWTNGPEYFRRNLAPNPNGSQSTRSNSKRSTVQQVYWRRGTTAADTAVGLPGRSHCPRFCLLGDRHTLRRMYSLPHNTPKQARCESIQHSRFDRKALMPTDISKYPFHQVSSQSLQRLCRCSTAR